LQHREERDHLVTFLYLARARSDIVPRALGALLVLELAVSSSYADQVVAKSVTVWSRGIFWLEYARVVRPRLPGYLCHHVWSLVELWRMLNRACPRQGWDPIIRNRDQETDYSIARSVTIWSRSCLCLGNNAEV
jgi:hypothetical protein